MTNMNRKPLIAFLIIGLVATIAGAGLYAYFSDTETSRGNTFTATTLDLKVDGCDDPNVPVYFNISDVKPGDSSSVNITLTNAGSINGTAFLTFTNVTDYPGTTPESELILNGEDKGELSEYLYMRVYVDDMLAAQGYLSELAESAIGLGSLPANESITMKIEWTVGENASNVIMGDAVTFDMLFSLEQVRARGYIMGAGVMINKDEPKDFSTFTANLIITDKTVSGTMNVEGKVYHLNGTMVLVDTFIADIYYNNNKVGEVAMSSILKDNKIAWIGDATMDSKDLLVYIFSQW
jgi:predicted ribosomally synthesized peptide with SipW-like signal peptide